MSNKQPDTIDEIIQELWNKAFNTAPQYGSKTYMKRKDNTTTKAKAALSAMVTEIIGEDEPYAAEAGVDQRYKGAWDDNTWNRNGLRNEQRQRAIAKGFTL